MITANDIVKANEVLKNVVERTPLDFDRYLSEKYGATIYCLLYTSDAADE